MLKKLLRIYLFSSSRTSESWRSLLLLAWMIPFLMFIAFFIATAISYSGMTPVSEMRVSQAQNNGHIFKVVKSKSPKDVSTYIELYQQGDYKRYAIWASVFIPKKCLGLAYAKSKYRTLVFFKVRNNRLWGSSLFRIEMANGTHVCGVDFEKIKEMQRRRFKLYSQRLLYGSYFFVAMMIFPWFFRVKGVK